MTARRGSPDPTPAPLRTNGGFEQRPLAALHAAALRDYQQRLAALVDTAREEIRRAVVAR